MKKYIIIIGIALIAYVIVSTIIFNRHPKFIETRYND